MRPAPAHPPFFFGPLAELVLERVYGTRPRPIVGPSHPARTEPPPAPAPAHPLRDLSGYDVSYVGGSYLHYKCSVC